MPYTFIPVCCSISCALVRPPKRPSRTNAATTPSISPIIAGQRKDHRFTRFDGFFGNVRIVDLANGADLSGLDEFQALDVIHDVDVGVAIHLEVAHETQRFLLDVGQRLHARSDAAALGGDCGDLFFECSQRWMTRREAGRHFGLFCFSSSKLVSDATLSCKNAVPSWLRLNVPLLLRSALYRSSDSLSFAFSLGIWLSR